MSAAELHWWLAAFACFSLFVSIGVLVSRRTPTRIDVEAVVLRGTATVPAALFTRLGYWPAIAAVSAFATLGAWFFHANVQAVLALIVTQSISQAALAATKLTFRRQRPDYWIVHQEVDLSFPSGHAATAAVLYFGLLVLVARTPAVPHAAALLLLVILGACTLAVPWSRLALGAHYLTDVAGGLLFGAGSLCATIAILIHAGQIAGQE